MWQRLVDVQFKGDLRRESEQLRYMIVLLLVTLKGKDELSWTPSVERSAVTQVLLLLMKLAGRITKRWVSGVM